MSLQNKHGKLENLHYHGFVSHSETSQYLCAFDILIAPYQNHVSTYGGDINIAQWMSPLKIFEYMSAGKPIISSNLPAIKEILQHGETALLCDPDNIDEWVENIENLKNTQLQKNWAIMQKSVLSQLTLGSSVVNQSSQRLLNLCPEGFFLSSTPVIPHIGN